MVLDSVIGRFTTLIRSFGEHQGLPHTSNSFRQLLFGNYFSYCSCLNVAQKEETFCDYLSCFGLCQQEKGPCKQIHTYSPWDVEKALRHMRR